MSYSEYLKLVKASVERNHKLPLKEFIIKVMQETGHDLNLINNIYIEESVEDYPGIGVCYMNNGEYVLRIVDDRGRREEDRYTDPFLFFLNFCGVASICRKMPGEYLRNCTSNRLWF